MPETRGTKRKRERSVPGAVGADQVTPTVERPQATPTVERLHLVGEPQPGSSEPRTGAPTGNAQNKQPEPSLLNFVDFEKIMADSNITEDVQQSESSSNLPSTFSVQSISFCENRVRLGAEDISSHVPEQLCNKIWAHEYVNISLLLKGSVELQDLFSSGVVHLTGKGHLEARPLVNTKDKVSSIEKWTDAFLIFASIYLKRFPNKTQQILQYINIIREAASRSVTFTWRTYDEQFQLRQASDLQPWGKINSDLWLRLMTSSTVSSLPQSGATSTSGGYTGATSKSDQTHVVGTCFDFNDGFCSRSYCKFKHICSNCNYPSHGRVNCFRQANYDTNKGNMGFRGQRDFNYTRRGRAPPRRGNRP